MPYEGQRFSIYIVPIINLEQKDRLAKNDVKRGIILTILLNKISFVIERKYKNLKESYLNVYTIYT
jgi:hypothetical protein